MSAQGNEGLETLLDLDGEAFRLENGFWTKFEVKRIAAPTPERPLGIRYSLTLHDPHNRRVLGFDNAHAGPARRRGYGARKTTWDHKHERERIEHYDFTTPARLLEDFWKAVEEIISAERNEP